MFIIASIRDHYTNMLNVFLTCLFFALYLFIKKEIDTEWKTYTLNSI